MDFPHFLHFIILYRLPSDSVMSVYCVSYLQCPVVETVLKSIIIGQDFSGVWVSLFDRFQFGCWHCSSGFVAVICEVGPHWISSPVNGRPWVSLKKSSMPRKFSKPSAAANASSSSLLHGRPDMMILPSVMVIGVTAEHKAQANASCFER